MKSSLPALPVVHPIARRSARPSSHPLGRARGPLLAAVLLSLALPAMALYKVVGPDGRVTYTDRPPTDGGAQVSTLTGDGAVAAVSAPDRLPPDLRQAATRFPVTLYYANDCPPCDAARDLLVQRGVPFTEKRVISDDDAAALERAIGVRTVPSLTIGKQVLRGLSGTEWQSYLDAAGYPRESRLPRDWQQPEGTALVERETPRSTARTAPPAAAARASAPVPAAPLPGSPTGLRF